jgi:hypothetical protein
LSPVFLLLQLQENGTMIKIQVRLESGAIRDVQGIPPGYTVEVLDYDISRRDLPELSADENHRMCVISEWTADNAAKEAAG